MANDSAPPKRTRDPEAKKRAVLNAALKELAVHGFGGFRTEKVALIAGVSVGTIFKIFPDKKALANAVYKDCIQEIRAVLQPAFSPQLTGREAFNLMWKSYSDLYFRNPDCLVFFEYQLTANFLDSQSRMALQQQRQEMVNWIKKQQDAGVLKKYAPELLRVVAIGPILKVVRESLDGHLEMNRAKFQELNELVWDAIAEVVSFRG